MTDQHTYSAADMPNRVVRFDDLKHTGTPLMFIDSILPNHWCMNYAVIGTAGSDPGAAANRAIAAPHAFQVRMGWAPPGNGPAWHTHDYVELIVILDGEWRFAWGYSEDRARPDGEFILGKWDMISAPAGVWRSFDVVGDGIGWFLAVAEPHEGSDGRDPRWPPAVVNMARAAGFHADDSGRLIKAEDYPDVRAAHERRLLSIFKDVTGVPLPDFRPE